jgi:hypothetical protein
MTNCKDCTTNCVYRGKDNQARCGSFVGKVTNADRIRAMTDEELANFMAERTVNESTLHRLDKDHGLTAVQIEAIKHNVYCAFMQWLQQPAEGE